MKKRIALIVIATIFILSSLHITNFYIHSRLEDSAVLYYIDYNRAPTEKEWFENHKKGLDVCSECLSLYALLKNGEYENFEDSFLTFYENTPDKKICYNEIARVFCAKTADLSHKEAGVLIEVLNKIADSDKEAGNNHSVAMNYAVQEYPLYHSGRFVSLYRVMQEIEIYSEGEQ